MERVIENTGGGLGRWTEKEIGTADGKCFISGLLIVDLFTLYSGSPADNYDSYSPILHD